MEVYKTKVKRLSGTSYKEIYPQALAIYKEIASKTKRRAYIRSTYFGNKKIFLEYFWQHIRDKFLRDRVRRLKEYACALDLLRYSHCEPVIKRNPSKPSEILYRFSGINGNGEKFVVQVKEDTRTGGKHFMSTFPLE